MDRPVDSIHNGGDHDDEKQIRRLCLMMRARLVGKDGDVGYGAGREDDYDDDGDADGSR